LRTVSAAEPSSDRSAAWATCSYELSAGVPALTADERFRRPEEEYYRACMERIDDLAYWFFTGESRYEGDHVWEPL
jgi:hypothetical protein